MQDPRIAAIKKNPNIIMFLFDITIALCFCMFACFLYELTYEKAAVRAKVFKSEISKVFFQIIFFYVALFI